MCLTALNPDVQEIAEDGRGQADRELPGVAWGLAGDRSVHPVEDLADELH
jgi:hypothetical protein